jgi:branched-chain amino acid transport system ATP-binding protein
VTDGPALLVVDGLAKRFGQLVVVADLSFEVRAGQALGVVGPNGAGKSTMLNLINGVIAADRGSVHFDGRDISRLGAAQRCVAGIARTYQVPQPFEGMTVLENVLVGAELGSGRRTRNGYELAYEALDATGLLPVANVRAGGLPLLSRKRLEMARALATDPQLILLDEVAGGLTDQELPALVETVRGLRDRGVAVIWIEHIVHALLAVVDRLMCLTYGTMLAIGEPHEVLRNEDVRSAYLGSSIDVEGAGPT